MYGIPRDDRTIAYWIVPAGSSVRHAISTRPGALIHGERDTAWCGEHVKIPLATWGCEVPRSAAISQRCAECQQAVDDHEDVVQVAWDF